MRAEMTLETAEQLGALAHPMRQRALALLAMPRTNKQVATLLGESPARLHFHLQELARAGLIELVEARPKGGVIEKYYRAVAGSFRLAPALAGVAPGKAGMAAAALEAARAELTRAGEQSGLPAAQIYVTHERVALSQEALERVQVHLEAIRQEFLAAAQRPDEGQCCPVVFTALLHPTVSED